ncbi:glycosyltransferase [Geomonas sp. Red32]|uniref:glycosyltransferase n=1 Tax=Geomonas sp. Red32 TaxID=2912856 RepID=UPI00202CE26B|nr:glycosyltransferase [Geomonas sp. Red32]MCM0083369.1 glycosyltransferase [Geomonas sp. Red32]
MTGKRLKVCHVVSRLEVGGMENGVVNLCNGHDRSRIEPMICCLKGTGPMEGRLAGDVRVECLGFPEGRDLTRVLTVAGFFRRMRPDVVHTHGWGGGAWDGVVGARLAGCPVIINGEHGLIFSRPHQVLAQRMLARLATSFFSVSQGLKERVVRTLGISAEHIRVITNGVDLDRFAPGMGGKGFGSAGKRVICSVGTLKKEKNQLMLLKAVSELVRSGFRTEFELWLVGDGPDRGELEAFVEKEKLSGRVRFLGRREDIPALLAESSVLVSTSKAEHEGLSNVILEAMASALPVIATRSVGTGEVVVEGKTGYLVPEDDVFALCNRLKALLQDASLSRRMGDAGRALVTERYSIAAMIASYEEEYQRLYRRVTGYEIGWPAWRGGKEDEVHETA